MKPSSDSVSGIRKRGWVVEFPNNTKIEIIGHRHGLRTSRNQILAFLSCFRSNNLSHCSKSGLNFSPKQNKVDFLKALQFYATNDPEQTSQLTEDVEYLKYYLKNYHQGRSTSIDPENHTIIWVEGHQDIAEEIRITEAARIALTTIAKKFDINDPELLDLVLLKTLNLPQTYLLAKVPLYFVNVHVLAAEEVYNDQMKQLHEKYEAANKKAQKYFQQIKVYTPKSEQEALVQKTLMELAKKFAQNFELASRMDNLESLINFDFLEVKNNIASLNQPDFFKMYFEQFIISEHAFNILINLRDRSARDKMLKQKAFEQIYFVGSLHEERLVRMLLKKCEQGIYPNQ